MLPLIVAALMTVANARPEAGYSYPSPSGNQIQQGHSGGGYVQSGHSSTASGQSGYDYTPQVPLVHKHIYVHVAPPEPEVQQRPVVGPTSAPQKHYKIVFIKTPSAPAPSAPVIPALAQNQEKTLIYVLVKRPEDAPEISIPTAAPTQPSKPEVYFIKYKTQKETTSSGPSPQYGVPSNSAHTSQGSPSRPNNAYIPPSQSYGTPGQSGPY